MGFMRLVGRRSGRLEKDFRGFVEGFPRTGLVWVRDRQADHVSYSVLY
jgi:hypothetical protein